MRRLLVPHAEHAADAAVVIQDHPAPGRFRPPHPVPSVSVGEDGVVRYTLVVRTGGGATNVSFEGLRCDTTSQRVYAFGHPGSQWSRARISEWRDIVYREVNGHHYVLYTNYMCFGIRQRTARSLREIVSLLKNGPQRSGGN